MKLEAQKVTTKMVFLFTSDESSLGKTRPRIPRNPAKSEIQFPLLESPDIFTSKEIFHFINVNKVVGQKNNVKCYFKDGYENYMLAKKTYMDDLPRYNEELLNSFRLCCSDMTFDAIVYPESSSNWLREGLIDTFSGYLGLETYEAKKVTPFKSSSCDIGDVDFRFDDQSLFKANTILILDDCYCKGQTATKIMEILGLDKHYAIACYFQENVVTC